MKVELNTLSFFAYSMAKCVGAGLGPGKALETSIVRADSKAFQRAIDTAVAACDRGRPISEGLEQNARLFPHFFIPVIRAGEASGRLEAAFMLLHEHCERLAPSLTMLRNTWRIPLVCILMGWFIRTGIFLYFGMYSFAGRFVLDSFVKFTLLGVAVYFLLKLRAIRRAVDRVLLSLPIIGVTEVSLATALFFESYSLMLKAGGLEVVTMFDLALATIRNTAIQADFRQARRALEQRESFEDAFGRPALLAQTYKGLITTGALSGKLDQCMERVAALARESLEDVLRTFHQFFFRVVVFAVSMSIVGTIYMCVMYNPSR